MKTFNNFITEELSSKDFSLVVAVLTNAKFELEDAIKHGSNAPTLKNKRKQQLKDANQALSIMNKA